MLRLSRFGLAAALAIACIPAARAAEPDKLLPADADTVVSVNLKQILDSDIIKKYALEQLKQALQGNDAQKLLTDLGLDPLKDVDKVVIGGSGKDQSDIKALVVIHGKFDPEKLYKAAEAQTKRDGDRFSLVKDGKDVMFKFQPDNGNPVYGTVVDDKRVIIGTDKKLVSTALASAGETKSVVGKEVATLVNRMDDKASLWVVSVVKGKLDKVKLPGGAGGNPAIQGQISNLETVSLVIRVTTDVSIDVGLGMKDEAAAEEMGKTVDELLQTVKGAFPFLAAQNPQMKPLAEDVKSLKSTVNSKAVSITGKLRGSAIGDLLNSAP